MEWAEEKEVIAGMLEECASTVRAGETSASAAPAFLRVILAGMKMLGEPAEMILSVVALPFGGIEGLQAKIDQEASE